MSSNSDMNSNASSRSKSDIENSIPEGNWRNQNLDIKQAKQSRRCKSTILEPKKNSNKIRVFMNANLWRKSSIEIHGND